MSEESCNSLIEQLHNLKIQLSSNSSCENNSEQLGTLECDAPSNGETANKAILSPIAVRCAGRPPSLRKESRVDKAIREAREKKKKAELREKKKAAQKEKKKSEQEARSMKLKNKRCNAKRRSTENDTPQQEEMEQIQQCVYLDGRACTSTVQESFHLGSSSSNINPSMRTPLPYGSFEGSFHLGSSTGVMNPIMTAVPYGASQESYDFGVSNINPTMTATIPPGGSPAVIMPPILGNYTSMLFQQSSAALSRSPQLHFDATRGLSDMRDQRDT